jgi:hypothetical protein
MRTLFALMMAALLAGAGGLAAHEEFRIIGTIAKHAGAVITVTQRDGALATIRIDKQTAITRDKNKVDAAELKVGRTVVVDAYGDNEDDLLALEIRIVPPIGRTPK